MQLYQQFYRQYGVRRLQTMLSPVPVLLTALPRNSLLHWVSDDPSTPNVDTSKLYLQEPTGFTYVDFPRVLTGMKGIVGSTKMFNPKSETRPFFQIHKQYKYMEQAAEAKLNDRYLVIENYSYLNTKRTYATTSLADYNKFWNLHKTIWDNAAKIANVSDRNQFIHFNIPILLPSFSFLNLYIDKVTPAMLKVFDTPDKLAVLELWKWLSVTHRSSSLMGVIEASKLPLINLVFNLPDGKSSILNLAYVDSWIKGHDNQTVMPSITQLPEHQVQKVFLRYMMRLQASSIVTEEEVVEETTDPTTDTQIPEALMSQVAPTGFTSQAKVLEEEGEVDESLEAHLAAIDEELKTLDNIHLKQLQSKGVAVDETGDLKEHTYDEVVLTPEQLNSLVYGSKSYETTLKDQLDEYVEYGLLSAADYKKLNKDVEAFNGMRNPYGTKANRNETIVQAMTITPEMLKIDSEKTKITTSDLVVDQSMLGSTLQCYDEDYINNVMKKDILQMVAGIQRSGVIIKKYDIENEISVLGGYETHTLELKPIDGAASTIRFRIPIIDEGGVWKANGVKYRSRRQRVDMPIRKIDHNTVGLSTYYGKNFVTRGRLSAKSSLEWLYTQINKAYISEEDQRITDIKPGNMFDNNLPLPFIYGGLSAQYKSIKAGKFLLYFDYETRTELVTPELLKSLETQNKVLVGTMDRNPVVVDVNDHFFLFKNNEFTPLGNIYRVLQLPEESAPVDFTEVRIYAKHVPVGPVLAYFIGFKNLLKLIKAKFRTVASRRITDLQPNEYALIFRSESYIFRREDTLVALIMGGFLEFSKVMKLYEASDFERKDVYLNLFETKGVTATHIRELESTDQMFVDPISAEILQSMGEPTTFRGLLVRGTEMLLQYHHPDSQDMSKMRIRGYERISGFVYKELTTAIRQFKSKNISGKSKVEMSPYQVWSSIMKDPSIKIPEDINPIQQLKETEVVTYVGEGGRSKDSIGRKSRGYHPLDMGVVSEATVDSSDVGINTYLSANPNFKDLRGTVDFTKPIGQGNLMSTSANLGVATDHDQANRVNFQNIQNSATVSTIGYHQPLVRTGYEYVIGQRTSGMFSYTAKQEGKVTNLNKHGVIIQYADGTMKGIELGRVYGNAEGSTYPHDVVCPLSLGDSFKKGDPIAYNTGFFEPDMLDPKQICFKTSMLVKTVFMETNQTLEDSSSISASLSERLTVKTTKLESVIVDFKQSIHDIVKVGQTVYPKTTLMVIEDEITSNTGYFDEESLSVLKRLSNQAPSSKYEGTIDKIEVFYHGELADMHPSLRAIADASDSLLTKITSATKGVSVMTGQVTGEYRVKGNALTLDKAEIKFYTTISTKAGVGDKGVFASQLKSTFCEVMDYKMHTEDGTEIESIFGMKSLSARVVVSPLVMGTTATLLRVIAKKAVEIYNK